MPKLNVPTEYKGLYDVKQEPGCVIINGRRYPYPYRSIYQEYNYLELLEKWRAEGNVDQDNQPIFSKLKGRDKILAKQLWFQRDPSIPVWKLGKFDHIYNTGLATLFIFQILITAYMLYRIVVPKEKDIYDHNNWERWRKEAHH